MDPKEAKKLFKHTGMYYEFEFSQKGGRYQAWSCCQNLEYNSVVRTRAASLTSRGVRRSRPKKHHGIMTAYE